MSFHSNNKHKPDAKLFQLLTLEDGAEQMMWPDHCVQESKGSELHPDLVVKDTDEIVFKGTNSKVDSYSGFFDNDAKSKTELDDVLKKHKITHCYVVGLAFDYCVGFTALDSIKLGYKTYVLEDVARSVASDSELSMIGKLEKVGVQLIKSSTINSTW
jgi:nicotinamidase/pyrazinamidase